MTRSKACAKGVYAEPVAELALALLLVGFRDLGTYARATKWTGPVGRNLTGASITIVGGGGITQSLLRLLGPFQCDVTVVRRQRAKLEGATRIVTPDDLDEAITAADAVVLALALTFVTADHRREQPGASRPAVHQGDMSTRHSEARPNVESGGFRRRAPSPWPAGR